MVLDIVTICEQNNIFWAAQGVGALGVETIFEKMNGSAAFGRARGRRLGFGRMRTHAGPPLTGHTRPRSVGVAPQFLSMTERQGRFKIMRWGLSCSYSETVQRPSDSRRRWSLT